MTKPRNANRAALNALERHVQTNRQGGAPKGVHTNDASTGVDAVWLAGAFNMPENSVRHRLRNCPVLSTRKRGEKMLVKMYEVRVASRFLVTPAYSTKQYMTSLKKGDLPPQLQQAVWDAMLKRQKWEENAGELWRTEKVREALRSTFQTMKFTLQLWADGISQEVELTTRQRELLRDNVDGLQADLYDALVQQMAENATGSQLTDLEETFGETETAHDMLKGEDEDEDEELDSAIEALV
jgi:hypothetical protein